MTLCKYSAVRTVAAAAVRHCTPATRGVFHTAAVLTINIFCSLYERTFFTVEVHPLAEQSLAYVRLRLHLSLYHTSFRQYGHARSRRRASARRGEAPLVYIICFMYEKMKIQKPLHESLQKTNELPRTLLFQVLEK